MAFLSGTSCPSIDGDWANSYSTIIDLMGGGFSGFNDLEDDKSPNFDEDLRDDPLMQMDMPVGPQRTSPGTAKPDEQHFFSNISPRSCEMHMSTMLTTFIRASLA